MAVIKWGPVNKREDRWPESFFWKNFIKQLDLVSPQVATIRIKQELAEAYDVNRQLQDLNNDLSVKVRDLDKELKLIYKSTKWRYATKAGIIFNRIKDIFISNKRTK